MELETQGGFSNVIMLLEKYTAPYRTSLYLYFRLMCGVPVPRKMNTLYNGAN